MTDNHPLLRALSMQVERVPQILVGLSESELRQSAVQSGWSPLGMSVHVREGVRFFLDEIMLGNAPNYSVPGDFEVDPGLNGTEVLAVRARHHIRAQGVLCISSGRPAVISDTSTLPAKSSMGQLGIWR